jgi:hypothetical protein
MQQDGINWIRVWVTWQYPVTTGEDVSAVDWKSGTGAAREPYMTRLKQLVAECNSRGMIVDCTFSSDYLQDIPNTHIECVKTLATHLKNYRNVYFDVANEFGSNEWGSKYPYSRITGLINKVKEIDSTRLCTASGGNPLDLGSLEDLLDTGVDFISPHFRGSNDTADKTVGNTKTIIQNMTTLNRRKPIHYQEPHRRNETNDTWPTQDFYYRDITGAKIAEAAGWCFHNGCKTWDPPARPYRSFLMNNTEGCLYAQLDSVELDALNHIKKQICSTSMKVRRYQAEYSEQVSHEKGQREMDFYWGAGSDWCNGGYLTYGPWLNTVTPGIHQVGWDVMINSTEGENDLIAKIEVTSNGQVMAAKDIYRYDFYGGYDIKTFFLQFTTTGNSNLEFTTLWYDNSDLFVDNITLYMHSGPLTDTTWRFQLISNGWIGSANEQGCTVTASVFLPMQRMPLMGNLLIFFPYSPGGMKNIHGVVQTYKTQTDLDGFVQEI